jgi:hypothetical protein
MDDLSLQWGREGKKIWVPLTRNTGATYRLSSSAAVCFLLMCGEKITTSTCGRQETGVRHSLLVPDRGVETQVLSFMLDSAH